MSEDQSPDLFWQAWTAPKAGNTSEQNEDAYRAEVFPVAAGTQALTIAIADGATEAVYSRLWAQTLVAAAEPDWTVLSDEELTERLQRVRQGFSPLELGKELPWYVRNKFLLQGSQATLLVVTIEGAADAEFCTVRAVAVGDCCLLLFREGGEGCSFPLHHSEDFGVNPSLVRNRHPNPLEYLRWEGKMGPGDLLLVCTDAVSKWTLQCVENNQATLLFDALLRLLTPETFDPSPVVGAAVVENSQPATVQPTPVTSKNSTGVNEKSGGRSSKLRRLLESLTGGSPMEPVESDELRDHQPITSELASVESTPDKDEIAADRTQSVTPTPVSDSGLRFAEFIESYRGPEKKPQMRNDDATLVICLPLHKAKIGQRQQVLDIIGKHKTIAERQPFTNCETKNTT